MSTPPAFLVDTLADRAQHDTVRVTLTFAQSLDAKIAGIAGKQLILSGTQSMIMTHWMRTMHDAILIGIGTALNDDPQLNTRHLPPRPEPYHLPRPIVLDSDLRLPPTCKLLANYNAGRGRRPWVVCAALPKHDADADRVSEWQRRREALEIAGATIIALPAVDPVDQIERRIPIPTLLRTLYERGVRSLMVEGGARIIASFFAAHFADASPVVDTIILTVAPTFVGDDGVGYGLDSTKASRFKHAKTEVMGKDTVVALRISHNSS